MESEADEQKVSARRVGQRPERAVPLVEGSPTERKPHMVPWVRQTTIYDAHFVDDMAVCQADFVQVQELAERGCKSYNLHPAYDNPYATRSIVPGPMKF